MRESQIAILTNQLEQTEGKLANVENSLAKNQDELTDFKDELLRTVSKILESQAEVDNYSRQGLITEILRPVGPGSEVSIDFVSPSSPSTHYDKVNEVFPDDDISYIENKNGLPTTWQRDLFTLQNHLGNGSISSVRVYVRTKHNTSQCKASIRTHDTTYDSPPLAEQATWKTYSYAWSTNPYTGAAWTWDEIDALEAGVSLEGTNQSPDWSNCTQVYVEVEYLT